MLNPEHFRRLVIVPALAPFPERMRTEAAVNLLLGTALVESQLTWLRQGMETASDGRGVALGLYQIEPRTHHDCWRNYIMAQRDIWKALGNAQSDDALIYDLVYATRIARIIYWRDDMPLPQADDVEGLARMWKHVYNTSTGAGSPDAFILRYLHAISLDKRLEALRPLITG